MHRRGGSRSHPSIVSSGLGLNALWLLWDISRGWIRYYGCSRRHRKRCFGSLNWRDVCGSPGSACGISGRGTGLNPRPISMSSSRPNHCGRLANGNWARPTVEGPKWAAARVGFGIGESYRVRSFRGWLKENGGALFMVLVVN